MTSIRKLKYKSQEEQVLVDSVLSKLYPAMFDAKTIQLDQDDPTLNILIERCCFAMRMLRQRKPNLAGKGDCPEARAAILWRHCVEANRHSLTQNIDMEVSIQQLNRICGHMKPKQFDNLDRSISQFIEPKWLTCGKTVSTTRKQNSEHTASRASDLINRKKIDTIIGSLAIKLSSTTTENLILRDIMKNIEASSLATKSLRLLELLQRHYSSTLKHQQQVVAHQKDFAKHYQYYALVAMYVVLKSKSLYPKGRLKTGKLSTISTKQKVAVNELEDLLVEQAQLAASVKESVCPIMFRKDIFKEFISFSEKTCLEILQKENEEPISASQPRKRQTERVSRGANEKRKRLLVSAETNKEEVLPTDAKADASLTVTDILAHAVDPEEPKFEDAFDDNVKYNILEERWGENNNRNETDITELSFDEWKQNIVEDAIKLQAGDRIGQLSKETHSEFLNKAADTALKVLGLA